MNLSQKLKNIVAPPAAQSQYDQALEQVRVIAKELQAALNQPQVLVQVVPGHTVNMGQQFRFVLRRTNPDFSDTLFRCYIRPIDGFPVTLSLYEDENVQCANQSELEDKIACFLARATIAERIRSVGASP